MDTQRKAPRPVLQPEEILVQNPKIDFRIVKAHKALHQELKKLGVKPEKPGYNLEPPLGRNRTGFHNRSG